MYGLSVAYVRLAYGISSLRVFMGWLCRRNYRMRLSKDMEFQGFMKTLHENKKRCSTPRSIACPRLVFLPIPSLRSFFGDYLPMVFLRQLEKTLAELFGVEGLAPGLGNGIMWQNTDLA